jgi:hypothetical protein
VPCALTRLSGPGVGRLALMRLSVGAIRHGYSLTGKYYRFITIFPQGSGTEDKSCVKT